MKNVNKNELLQLVQAELQENGINIPKKTINLLVNVVFRVITNVLIKGGQVKIVGFGLFSPRVQAGRNRRNPTTGGSVFTPARTVVKFKPSKTLKDSVRESNVA